MAEIVPTVLCENAEDYKLTIERLSPFAKRVHLDLADGEFAPTKTVELSEMWWPQDWQVDIHAMERGRVCMLMLWCKCGRRW